MSDKQIIKISLVLSGEDNALEFHRILPESYFNGCKRCDHLFTEEINSLRQEAYASHPEVKNWTEHIRIASIDRETGAATPSARPPKNG